MKYIKLFFTLVLILNVNLVSCGGVEKKKSDSQIRLIQLNDKIREERFFEKLSEENLKQKAKTFLHAAEELQKFIDNENK
ncbi:MAG: hypothetical protein QME25_09885 [Bacteroidota bacterium]|nr:hypothetical protein [Bacteroidota bacterium]